ncbi:hypothetical protein BJ875DRAFT_530813 [Amylocarpus encephaloides]|uniref:Uncharacterized protein n=1 Tax=Amylocarpus encephaloides TaxID=45428 RepID=A0A9P7YK88_9HELO|nr:hypothetical protein BJ875DRAFT_530813 [Amylocarpus encephaloides]
MRGQILRADRTGDFTDSSSLFNNTTAQANFSQEIRARLQGFSMGLAWHNTTSTVGWVISFSRQEVPDAAVLAPQLESLYGQLFATLLSLNPSISPPPPSDRAPIVAYAVFEETRIFVSPLMLKISLVIMAFNLVVAIAYYVQRPKRFLPRLPTSIASVMAYLAGSRAAEDFKLRKWGEKDARFGYGRFVGTDGQTYVGIESQRYVVPLESQNPDVKMGWLAGLREIGRKEDRTKVKTWI